MAIPEPPMLTTQLLAAIRAQEYPNIIDDNGQPWYMNAIRRLETSRLALLTEVERLKAELDKSNGNRT